VIDHCSGIEILLARGAPGEVYNVGAGNHMKNIEMTHLILEELGKPQTLIKHVRDRAGHDVRYAIDATKLRNLGWEPEFGTKAAILHTVRWYAANEAWWKPLKSGEFRKYYERQYRERLDEAGD